MNLKSTRPSFIRQTSLWMIIFSMTVGPSWPRVVYAENHAKRSIAGEDEPVAAVSDDNDDEASSSNKNAIIAPGFKIRLVCSSDMKLNGDFRVSSDGELSLPYNMSVRAAGLKVKALENQLVKTYKPYFKGEPRITASIVQKRYSVKITGVVKAPGTYLIKDHTTLDEALAMAQVRTEDLSSGYVRLGTGTKAKWISMDDYMKGGPAHDLPAWRGGEQILFQLERPEGDSSKEAMNDDPSVRKIQVLGEVRNPGPVSFQRHADGYYYLIQRGGPTQFSDLGEVEVLRKDPKSNEHTRVSLGDLKNVKEVRESDVIIVHPDRPSSGEHALQDAGIVATILSAIVLTVFVVRNK